MPLWEPFDLVSAAFGRLCVETNDALFGRVHFGQPPSGGCVLKQVSAHADGIGDIANQPPSGGCVLKLLLCRRQQQAQQSAAFGRLCVETNHPKHYQKPFQAQPPSGGCVLKQEQLL